MTDVMLIHNGSLAEHRQKLKDSFPGISHFEITENKGFTCGTNAGLKHCFETHEWVYFITNDCELVTPLTLPQTSGFYAPTIFRRKIGTIDSKGGRLNLALGKLHHCKNREDFEKIDLLSKSYIPGTAFILHRNFFQQVGDFDESLHTYWEDVDFSLRAQKLGLTLSLSEENQLTHKIGKTCHKDKFYTQHLFWKNRETITKRHGNFFVGLFFKTQLKIESLKLKLKRRR